MATHYGYDEVNTSNSSGNNDEENGWYNIIKDIKSNEEIPVDEQGQSKSFWKFINAHHQMIKVGLLQLDSLPTNYNPHEGNTSRKWLKCKLLIIAEDLQYLYFSVDWKTHQYFTQNELENVWWTINNDSVLICVAKRLTEVCAKIKKAKVILLRKVFSNVRHLYANMSQALVATIPNTNIVEIFPKEEHADSTNLVHNNHNNNEYTFDQSDSMEAQQYSTSSQSYESTDNIGSDECNQNSNFAVQTTSNNNNPPTKERKLDQVASSEDTSSILASSQESSSAPSTDGIMYSEYLVENRTCAACGNNDLINADYFVIHHNLKVVFDVVARHYYHTSDQRLKYDIANFNEGVEILMQLDPKCFRWKSTGPFSDPIIGLIAQEVQKVAPSLVKEGQDGYLSIDYGQIIVILIEATKQQLSDSHASNDEQKALQNSLRLLEEEFKGLFNTVSKVVQNQQRQQEFNEERFIRLETRLTHLENDNHILFLTNCMQIENIFTTLEHGHKLKMTQISIFESLVFEKQNWTRIERQNLMLKLIFLFPSYVGNFTRKQVHGILKQIQSVTLWAKAETDAMAKLCVGVLLYNSGKRSKAAQQLQQLVKAHDTQTQKMALAYLIAINYSNDNEECAMKLTDRLQSMLPNDKEKNYYGNQIAMTRVSFFFNQKQVEKMEQAISEWANIVTDETKGESTEHKKIRYVPINISLADCKILRSNYAVAEQILNDCLSTVGHSSPYTPLLKSKLLGVLTKQHKYKKAISLSEELLLMESKNRNDIGILSELSNLVTLYSAVSKEWSKTSLEDHFSSLLGHLDFNATSFLLPRIVQLARQVMEKFTKADKTLELLEKLIAESNTDEFRLNDWILLEITVGEASYSLKKWEKAKESFEFCYGLLSNDHTYRARIKQLLARACFNMEVWEQAAKHYKDFLDLTETRHDIIEAMVALSEIYMKTKQYNDAEGNLLECLEIIDNDQRMTILIRLLLCYKLQGNENGILSTKKKISTCMADSVDWSQFFC